MSVPVLTEPDLFNALGGGGDLTAALLVGVVLVLGAGTGTLGAARGEDGAAVESLLLLAAAFALLVLVLLLLPLLTCSAERGYKRCMNSSAARGDL